MASNKKRYDGVQVKECLKKHLNDQTQIFAEAVSQGPMMRF
ncbi:hypothetical protein [Zobellia alginiliquefaciens]|nr:hypothetical protein [Zobellia alginiliquefaciens]